MKTRRLKSGLCSTYVCCTYSASKVTRIYLRFTYKLHDVIKLVSLKTATEFQSSLLYKEDSFARTYLQPHYDNGVFGNVYLLALYNIKR